MSGRCRVNWKEIERFVTAQKHSLEIADLEPVMGMESRRLKQWRDADREGGAIAQRASVEKVRQAWYESFTAAKLPHRISRDQVDLAIGVCFRRVDSHDLNADWESRKYAGEWSFHTEDVAVPGVLEYKYLKKLKAEVRVTPLSRMTFKAEGSTYGAISGDPSEIHDIEIVATIVDPTYIRTHYSISIPERNMHASGVAMLYNLNDGLGLEGYYVARPTGQVMPVAFGSMKIARGPLSKS